MKHYYSSYSLMCPYCETENDPFGRRININGGPEDFECDHCQKTFSLDAHVCFTSKPDCTLNGDVHDFVTDKAMALYEEPDRKWVKCTKCELEKCLRTERVS